MEEKQSDRVFEFIMEQIRSERWKPGDQTYTDMEFCEHLGVSRVVAREAVEKCVGLGILKRRRGQGTFVQDPSIRKVMRDIAPLITMSKVDFLDVMEFRLHFEPGNVEQFMANKTAEDVEKLDENYRKMKEISDDPEKFSKVDDEFHRLIALGTHNPITIDVRDMLSGVLTGVQQNSYLRIGPQNGLYYHGEILQAIRSEDMELARMMMERHIRTSIQEIREAMKAGA